MRRAIAVLAFTKKASRRFGACVGALWLLLLGGGCGGIAAEANAAETHKLADQVRGIFQAKCAECHDEATAPVKGDFGYVLDLRRVAANREWVIPGNAEKSELYQLVKDDEMPGEDASSPPLTPEEKETVKRWVNAGAPAAPSPSPVSAPDEPAPTAALLTEKQVAGASPALVKSGLAAALPRPALDARKPPVRQRTFWQRLIRALGQFHPPSSHFPIGLLIAALPAEFMWQRTHKPTWKAVVRFCVMLGAASAVATAGLGWCAAAFTNYGGGANAPVLWWHRWLGTATAAWAVPTAILSELAHRRGQPRALRYAFRAALAAGVALVGVAGYLGGSLIYGLRHFSW